MFETQFDRIVKKLGFRSGAELARELRRSRKAASRWRREGFPATIRCELLQMAPKRGVVISHDELIDA